MRPEPARVSAASDINDAHAAVFAEHRTRFLLREPDDAEDRGLRRACGWARQRRTTRIGWRGGRYRRDVASLGGGRGWGGLGMSGGAEGR
eukprot:289921-Rhodomonas_salina.1